jgi:hypothetical protein
MLVRAIGGLLDRAVLLVGTTLGACVPGFVVQYRQRVGGRLDQVELDLAPFREIARQQHGGSLDALIQHHLQSSDATFHAEGRAVQAMVDSEASLRGMMEALQGSVLHQLTWLIPHYDRGIAQATWQSYVPAINLETSSIIVSLLIGVTLWLVFLALWHGSQALWRRLTTTGSRVRPRQPRPAR